LWLGVFMGRNYIGISVAMLDLRARFESLLLTAWPASVFQVWLPTGAGRCSVCCFPSGRSFDDERFSGASPNRLPIRRLVVPEAPTLVPGRSESVPPPPIPLPIDRLTTIDDIVQSRQF
jgi:hypothetical protein